MPSLEDIKGKVFEFGGNGYAQGNSPKSNSKTTDGGRDDETKDNENYGKYCKGARPIVCSRNNMQRS